MEEEQNHKQDYSVQYKAHYGMYHQSTSKHSLDIIFSIKKGSQ